MFVHLHAILTSNIQKNIHNKEKQTYFFCCVFFVGIAHILLCIKLRVEFRFDLLPVVEPKKYIMCVFVAFISILVCNMYSGYNSILLCISFNAELDSVFNDMQIIENISNHVHTIWCEENMQPKINEQEAKKLKQFPIII